MFKKAFLISLILCFPKIVYPAHDIISFDEKDPKFANNLVIGLRSEDWWTVCSAAGHVEYAPPGPISEEIKQALFNVAERLEVLEE